MAVLETFSVRPATARRHGGHARTRSPSRIAVIAAFTALSLAYLLFVAHYSINIDQADDWTVLPLIHAALHGQLSFGALWTQHNENRMLVANAVFVALGVATRDNLQVVMFVSAGIFIATFAGFLHLFRAYFGRLIAWAVLATGVVWFSVADWSNALWAFQLAWYLVLAFFVAMLSLLLLRGDSRRAFGLALACAVLASYSSLQGLLLWPLGLVCLMWVRPWPPRRIIAWVSSGAVATVVYFAGYRSIVASPDGLYASTNLGVSAASPSPVYALAHPLFTARFFLVVVGDGLPLRFEVSDPGAAVTVGAVTLIVALFVVVRGVRRRQNRIDCLPVALVGFGLLLDLVLTFGRVNGGVLQGAFAPRYSMGGLLILVGILTYAWANVRARLPVVAALVGLLALQVGTSAHLGIQQSVANRQSIQAGARIIAHAYPAQGCARLTLFFDLAPPGLTTSFVHTMEADRLNFFAPGALAQYRAEGLPKMVFC